MQSVILTSLPTSPAGSASLLRDACYVISLIPLPHGRLKPLCNQYAETVYRLTPLSAQNQAEFARRAAFVPRATAGGYGSLISRQCDCTDVYMITGGEAIMGVLIRSLSCIITRYTGLPDAGTRTIFANKVSPAKSGCRELSKVNQAIVYTSFILQAYFFLLKRVCTSFQTPEGHCLLVSNRQRMKKH